MAPPKPQQTASTAASATATVSRSRSACYACRARKQKCDGNRPVCSRCKSLTQICSWPRKQKRGPAKGYIEALETRLKETERIVWRFLSISTDDILSAAFSPEVQDQIPTSLSISTLGTTEEKKSAIAFWEQFPLHARDDVLAWKEEIEYPSMRDGDGTTAMLVHQSYHSDNDGRPAEEDSVSHTEASPSDGGPGGIPLSAMDDDTAANVAAAQATSSFPRQPSVNMMGSELSHQRSTGAGAGAVSPSFLPPTPGTLEGQAPIPAHSSTTSTSSTGLPKPGRGGKFGLSQEFQDTFLW